MCKTIFLLSLFLIMTSSSKKINVTAELQEELLNVPLEIRGTVPTWLSGTLIRNGPISVTVNGETTKHWFDGLAMLHAFSFHNGNVQYSNKFLRSDAYTSVFEKGVLNSGGFASDPCRSLFRDSFTLFFPRTRPIHNANVNVAKLADTYVALTEIPLPVKFDLHTLETLGALEYQDELPKEKCWESAHPHSDQKGAWNYLVEFGRKSYYVLYHLENDQRKVLAKIPVKEPAYMHSFAMTENYLILTEFPLLVNPLDLITQHKAFIKNYSWKPEKGTRIKVISKKDGSLIGEYKTKPFFAFHHANAFEKDDTIHMDIVTYKDANVITGNSLYVDAKNNEGTPTKLERFSLSLTTGKVDSEILLPNSNEFPRINEKFDGKPYRYAYVTSFNTVPQLGDELYKVDTTTKQVWSWSEPGCLAGEPVFVAAPKSTTEDDGLVLALIIDHLHQDSFLLILNSKNFTEIARARAPHIIPKGLHGQYFE